MEEDSNKSCDEAVSDIPPKMESVAVGYDHFDGSSYDSENDESSSEVEPPFKSPENTKKASGDAPNNTDSRESFQTSILHISNQIISTFAANSIKIQISDLENHDFLDFQKYNPSKSNSYLEMFNTLLPVLKQKVDEENNNNSDRRDSLSSQNSSSMAIQTEADEPEILETKFSQKSDCGTQCELDKNSLQKLNNDNAKLTNKLENLQKDHTSTVKKLDSSKKLIEEEKDKIKSLKKSLKDEKSNFEHECSILKKSKMSTEKDLKILQDRTKILESNLKKTETDFSTEKMSLKNKYDAETDKHKNRADKLENVLQSREQEFAQKVDIMEARMKIMEKRKARNKLLLSVLFVVCFTLILPFLDIFICCENPVDYARQLLSWIDQSRFERLSNGKC